MFEHTKSGQPYVPRGQIPLYRSTDTQRYFRQRTFSNKQRGISKNLLDYERYVVDDTLSTNVTLKSNLDEIEKNFGSGTRLYFSFLKFMIFTNIVIAISGLISWIYFVNDPHKKWGFVWTDLFVSNYLRGYSDGYWFWCNVAIFIVCVLSIPVYFVWEFFIFKRIHPQVIVIEDRNDTIYSNLYKPTRYYIGILASFIALLIMTGVFYVLLLLQNYMSVHIEGGTMIFGLAVNVLMGIPVSLSYVISNMIWRKLSHTFTVMENNKKWSHFRVSRMSKLVLFKIISATILYVLISVVLVVPTNSDCLMQNSASSFAFTVFLDILMLIFVDTFWPILWRKFKISCCHASSMDENLIPDFEISDEILQIMYRQFILYMGIMIMPLLGILGVIGTALQYPIDKYRLLYVCKEPYYIEEKMSAGMLIFITVNIIAVTLCYPNGVVWTLFVPSLLPAGFQNCTVVGAINRI